MHLQALSGCVVTLHLLVLLGPAAGQYKWCVQRSKQVLV